MQTIPDLMARPSAPRVLIVDDNDLLRDVLALGLRQYGYVVDACSDGVQALRLCVERGRDVDLVITDLHMPVMGGLELIRHLRTLYPAKPILCMSAATPSVEQLEAFARMCVRFMEKPCSLLSLLDAVRTQVRAHLEARLGDP